MINHKFKNHVVSSDTSILILGTFHPENMKNGDFFYTRPHNFLWRILPICFNRKDLKKSDLTEKKKLMCENSVDFHDIIKSIQNPKNNENLINDKIIDKYALKFHDTITLLKSLENLKAVYFTRMTFDGIPKIANRMAEIRNYCVENNIRFSLLITPARYSNDDKINSWKAVIIDKTKCY
ncbi:MAG: hypothetical protein JJE55_13865 [Flavobacteriaceae bacterium]|nr:hypothetical protein [Flavobacteriaceae bacterium]